MRRTIFILISIIFTLFLMDNIEASSGRAPREEKESVGPPQVSREVAPSKKEAVRSLSKERQKKLEAKRLQKEKELLQKKKKALNNTEWDIEIVPIGRKGRKTKDTLIFKDMKVFSKNLKNKKFSPTNYSLHLNQDGTLVWETMQTNQDGKIVFWRGEVTSDMRFMRGIITFPDEEKNKDFSFKSTAKRILAP